jgi:hypothetical protein
MLVVTKARHVSDAASEIEIILHPNSTEVKAFPEIVRSHMHWISWSMTIQMFKFDDPVAWGASFMVDTCSLDLLVDDYSNVKFDDPVAWGASFIDGRHMFPGICVDAWNGIPRSQVRISLSFEGELTISYEKIIWQLIRIKLSTFATTSVGIIEIR